MKKFILGSLLIIGSLFFGNNMEAVKNPKGLPHIMVKKLNGDSAYLDTISQGRTKVISFWATWCNPCRRELALYDSLSKGWKSKFNVDFIAISVDTDIKKKGISNFIRNRGWGFNVVWDSTQSLSKIFNIQSIPMRLVVAKNGEVIEKVVGFKNDIQELEYKLEILK